MCVCVSACSWVSELQNSKEEALNTALGGDQLHLQDSGLQELSRAVIAELHHLPGNDVCADCGAPGQPITGLLFPLNVPTPWKNCNGVVMASLAVLMTCMMSLCFDKVMWGENDRKTTSL